MNNPKICVECRWHFLKRVAYTDYRKDEMVTHECHHGKGTKVDLVTGEKTFKPCNFMRKDWGWDNLNDCGPEGKLWEPKAMSF